MLLRSVFFMLLFCCSLGSTCVNAQISYTMQPLPMKTGANSKIVPLNNGDFAVLETVPGASSYTMIVSRYDGCAQPVWQKKISADFFPYRQSTKDYFCDLAGTADGGVLLAYTDKDSKEKCVISKLDGSGSFEWSLSMDLPYINMEIGSLKCTRLLDNSFLIAGTVDSIKSYFTGAFRSRYFAVRISASGKPLWSKSYNSFFPNDDFIAGSNLVNTILPMKHNACWIFGEIGKILIDSAGNIKDADQNYKPFPNYPGFSRNEVFCGSASGDYIYAAGQVHQKDRPDPGYPYGFLCKLDMDGKVLWSYFFDRPLFPDPWINHIGGIYVNQQSIVLATDIYLKSGFSTLLIECDLDGGVLGAKYFSDIETEIRSNEKFLFSSPDGNTIYLLGKNQLAGDTAFTRLHKIYKGEACDAVDTVVKLIPFTLDANKRSLQTYPGLSLVPASPDVSTCEYKPVFLCESSPIPIADLGRDTILCEGKEYTLRVRKKVSSDLVTWSTGSNDTAITIAKSGVYWARINGGYCVSTDTIRVVFKPGINIDLGKDLKVCPHDSIQLSVSDTFGVPFTWTTPKKNANGIARTLHGPAIWAGDTGNYYLSIDIPGTCAILDTIHIGNHFLPVAKAGPDTTLCYGQEYTMQGKGGISYRWIPAKYLSNDTIPDPVASPPGTQKYTLIVKNGEGCADTSEVWLKVRPPLQVTIQQSGAIKCLGDPVILTAQGSGGNPQGYKFPWTGAGSMDSTITVKPMSSAWYTVKLDDGCSVPAFDSIFITVPPMPKAIFSAEPRITIPDRAVSFHNKSKNASGYSWSFGDGSGSPVHSPVYQYRDTGYYLITLIAYNANGCSDTAYDSVRVNDIPRIHIPNVFSPNDDRTNDEFRIATTGISAYEYSVYNRWGERIFRTATMEHNWNGAIDNTGPMVPEGIYLYMLKATDYSGYHYYHSGTVQVLR